MTIKAITTMYSGQLFRSQLEAKWAIFFDMMGVAWRYEPQLFEIEGVRYLPDFFLPKSDLWVEVKRRDDPGLDKPKLLSKSGEARIIIFLGDPLSCQVFVPITCWRHLATPRLVHSHNTKLVQCDCGNIVVCEDRDEDGGLRDLGIVISCKGKKKHGPGCGEPLMFTPLRMALSQTVARLFRSET